MICKFCGLNNADDEVVCSRCGSPLKENRKPTAYASPNEPVVGDDKRTMRMENHPDKNTMAAHNPIQQQPSVDTKATRRFEVSAHEPSSANKTERYIPSNENISSAKNTERYVPSNENISSMKKTERYVPSNENISSMKKTERYVAPREDVSSMKKTERYVAPREDASSMKKTERYVAPREDVSSMKKTVRYVAPSEDASSIKKTVRYVAPSEQESGIDKKTVDVYRVHTPSVNETKPLMPPHCSLKPLAREDEDSARMMKQEYASSEVVLNRQNTEPDNRTITSKQQALLTFENGRWYIEDRSAFKSTFIRVTGKTELHDGDIVAMGDREFEFSTK